MVGSARSLVVWLSESLCIFENLAFEDVLYRTADLATEDHLLIWQNNPAVVIGRHQNPWLEADVKFLEENRIQLARRNSGGGTVYHDLGNLNFSVLTAKARHDRLKNMNLISRVLAQNWNIKTEVSKRHDLRLMPGDWKISGTAAKIGSKASYHHFTLMVNLNLDNMRSALNSSVSGIKTNATCSVPAAVITLHDRRPNVDQRTRADVIPGPEEQHDT